MEQRRARSKRRAVQPRRSARLSRIFQRSTEAALARSAFCRFSANFQTPIAYVFGHFPHFFAFFPHFSPPPLPSSPRPALLRSLQACPARYRRPFPRRSGTSAGRRARAKATWETGGNGKRLGKTRGQRQSSAPPDGRPSVRTVGQAARASARAPRNKGVPTRPAGRVGGRGRKGTGDKKEARVGAWRRSEVARGEAARGAGDALGGCESGEIGRVVADREAR